ncbi:MAG: sensor histidine kinase [Lachnospiraceae bacterium]|nr:sensor histidine kinase [Lachnospiraceae bacterium]
MSDRFPVMIIITVVLIVLILLVWEVIRVLKANKKLSDDYREVFDELQKTKERELVLRNKESEICASIGRQIIEPLNGVKFTSELLRTRFLSGSAEKDRDYFIDKLDLIYNKTDEMGIFAKTILSTALDDMGEFTVTCSDTESRSLEDMVKKHDHRHVVSMASIPYVLIHIDQLRMNQVIGNIIDNSYRYANSNIDISFLLTDDFLQMKIADHGEGVPDDEIEHITDRFYRGKKWLNSPEEGNGLGLFIARTLMEKMDGGLVLDNTGDGLCVTLLIKLGGS